jgi:hypothetical protein
MQKSDIKARTKALSFCQIIMVKEWKRRVVVRYHGWGEEEQEELALHQVRAAPPRKRKKNAAKKKQRTRGPAKKKRKRKPRDRTAAHDNNAVNCVDASAL